MSLLTELKSTAAHISPVDINTQANNNAQANKEKRRAQPRAPRPSARRKPARRAASRDRVDSGDDDDGGGDPDGDDGGGDGAPNIAPGNRTVVGGRVLIDHDGLRDLGLTYTRVRIWQMMKVNAFPRSVSFGRQKPYWVLAEIQQWIDDRFAARFARPDQHDHKAA
jgi:predicted DNA-binding transcriptional regulator AlpA